MYPSNEVLVFLDLMEEQRPSFTVNLFPMAHAASKRAGGVSRERRLVGPLWLQGFSVFDSRKTRSLATIVFRRRSDLPEVVPHAVESGQFAMEQTLIVPRDALSVPARAPIAILEKLAGHSLA